jgi:hypothetical protein
MTMESEISATDFVREHRDNVPIAPWPVDDDLPQQQCCFYHQIPVLRLVVD